jgi:hypothetical protein
MITPDLWYWLKPALKRAEVLQSTTLGEPTHDIVHRQPDAEREDNEGLAGRPKGLR